MDGEILQANSVEFGAHNNGKAPKSEISPPNSHSNQVPEVVVAEGNPDKKRKTENGTEHTTVVHGNLEVLGMVKAKAFMQFSDIRLKTNIEDLVDALDIIQKLEGKSYQWRKGVLDEQKGGKKVIGLIAQEVQKVVPEVVQEDPETGLLSVAYAELVPVIIEAFKQHMREYETEKSDVRNQLSEIKAKLDKVEKDNQKSIPHTHTYKALQQTPYPAPPPAHQVYPPNGYYPNGRPVVYAPQYPPQQPHHHHPQHPPPQPMYVPSANQPFQGQARLVTVYGQPQNQPPPQPQQAVHVQLYPNGQVVSAPVQRSPKPHVGVAVPSSPRAKLKLSNTTVGVIVAMLVLGVVCILAAIIVIGAVRRRFFAPSIPAFGALLAFGLCFLASSAITYCVKQRQLTRMAAHQRL